MASGSVYELMKIPAMRPSLSFKIIGVVLLISLFFFPPLAYINITNSREFLEASYLEKAKTIARSLDANIRSREELRDESRLLANIQKSIWLDPDIIGIDINLPDQDSLITFVSSKNERIGSFADVDNLDSYKKDILVSKIVTRDDQRYLKIVTPIHIAKQQVGTYQIELTLEHVDNQIKTAIKVSALSYLVTIFLFVLFLFWLIRLILIRPVKAMNRGVTTIAKGDLNYRVNIESSDEIGQLAAAFNQMTGDLKESRRSLEERRITLEQEVEERRRIEIKLRESEERFRNLAQTATDAIIGLDEQGHISIWNSAATRIFGFTESEAIGAALNTLIIPEQYHKKAYPALKKFFKTGTGSLVGQTVELIGLRKDGTEFPVELSISSVREDGVWHATGIARDITERKKMEEELLKVQKLESVGILAGGIAHDFNNILTVILGNISFAKMYTTSEDDIFETLTKAEKASLKARDLTQQLLTFSRGGAPVKKTASITKLLKESAGFILRGSNVRCEVSISNELWSTEIDEGQISQVINNLIINADQAMPEGGTIQVHAKNITVGVEDDVPLQDGEYVKITITDQGSGISPEHLQKIFDPYFTTKQKGSGLGLAISYSIINRHNGYITVESKLGIGTTFHIYLPASQKQIPIKKGVKKGPVMGKGKILVMDDDEVIRDFIDRVLAHLGYEVVCAEDGSEAIELYKRAKESNQSFDAVILDLTIPGGMGGAETIQKLLEMDHQVKAIVSSGYSNDPVMSNFQQYGFNGVITKPYKIQELSQVLHKIITGTRFNKLEKYI